MRQIIVLLMILVLMLSAACSETEFTKEELEQIVCTADVSECPDGSFVGRDPMNDCEFKECEEDNLKE